MNKFRCQHCRILVDNIRTHIKVCDMYMGFIQELVDEHGHVPPEAWDAFYWGEDD